MAKFSKSKRISRFIFGFCAFVIFIYIMAVLNLGKITKKLEWNIFKSEGLKELIVISSIVLIVFFVVGIVSRRSSGKFKSAFKDQNEENGKNEKLKDRGGTH